jgi:hypothetical protein
MNVQTKAVVKMPSKHQAAKMATVFHESKKGKLKSSSGDKVVNRKQAIAIALSEAGVSKKDKK